jgi:hypothetical protein
MGWDGKFFFGIPWDGMGREVFFWNPMGWDGTDQVVPWYDFVVPSHPIRSPGNFPFHPMKYFNKINYLIGCDGVVPSHYDLCSQTT